MEIKTLPNAVDIERAVLGAMIVDIDAISRVVEILKPDDFYLESHKIICEAIYKLYELGKPIDIILVTEQVKGMGKLEAIGGASYIADLTSSVVSSANIERHAEIIHEKAVLRDLIKTSNKIIEMAYKEEHTTEALLDAAEQEIFSIRERRKKGEVKHISMFMDDILNTIWERMNKRTAVTGIPSGFKRLDEVYTGGFQPSEFIVIAGRPSTGKTAIALNMATYMAVENNIPVVFFSVEMHWKSLIFRMLSYLTGIQNTLLRKGFIERDSDDFNYLSSTIAKLGRSPLWIDSTPGISIYELRAKTRRLKKEHDIKVMFVDYLQLIVGPRAENRQQEVAAISRALKNIARELDISVVALSQLSRAPATRGSRKGEEAEPVLSDLRESGQIEQDADLILFLHRKKPPQELEEKDLIPVQLIVAKHRNGMQGRLDLIFQKSLVRFREKQDTGVELEDELL